jgi:hypothetical protein
MFFKPPHNLANIFGSSPSIEGCHQYGDLRYFFLLLRKEKLF